MSLRHGAALDAIHATEGHEFWDNGFTYSAVPHATLAGPAQVTDAWLAELARRRNGRLATMDAAFATAHPDVAVLVPELSPAP